MNRGRVVALLAIVVAAVTVVSGGCQSYNYSPVGICVIQPGAKQVRLGDISTADILFVVDDSGSMDPKQQALADNFDVFIASLNAYNAERVGRGLAPFDFHIAVTTSSVFRNYAVSSAPSLAASTDRCVGDGATRQCCTMQPTSCVADAACSDTTAGAACGAAGRACLYNGASATVQCCAYTACQAVGTGTAIPGCMPGGVCGVYSESYESSFAGCTAGVAQPGQPYPNGNLVGAASNPRVLHFTKDLYTPTVNSSAIAALSAQFKQNIKVGSCGSGEEQHWVAAKLAIEKALANQQPGVTAGEWPHAGAKMVVVVVADEDDCSNRGSPDSSIVLIGDPGNDTCTANQNPRGQPGQFPVEDFESYFVGLGRPFGLGVIASADCSSGTCIPAKCSVNGNPYGYAPARRLLGVADGMHTRGYDVVEGSVCQPFGALLTQIADLVKAPSLLKLESLPASDEISVLRIIDVNGVQRKVCTQAMADAQRDGAGWWFAECGDSRDPPPVSPVATTCIYVNHRSANCEANPGETYSAEYLGQMPPGGCTPASPTATPSQACATALGASGAGAAASDWWCYGAVGAVGTCVCAAGQ
jgi:hypothetical protein